MRVLCFRGTELAKKSKEHSGIKHFHSVEYPQTNSEDVLVYVNMKTVKGLNPHFKENGSTTIRAKDVKISEIDLNSPKFILTTDN